MDFFTRLCKKCKVFFIIVLLALGMPYASAEDIALTQAAIHLGESASLVLTAQYGVTLTPVLMDALQHGVSLSFALDLEVTEPRWYWLDKKVLSWHQERRITYNPLTRTYRFYIGSIYLTFSELDEALRALEVIHPSAIPLDAPLKKDESYRAQLNFALDISQLPKPFQLDALYSSDWKFSAAPREWTFRP